MITKEITYDQQVLESGHIQVRAITRLMEEGKELSKTYHRHVVSPGDDMGKEDVRTVKIMSVVHTPGVIADYEELITKNNEDGIKNFLTRIILNEGIDSVNATIVDILTELALPSANIVNKIAEVEDEVVKVEDEVVKVEDEVANKTGVWTSIKNWVKK